jgi:trans-aconitate methyltransferase
MTVFDQHPEYWTKKSGIPKGLQRHLPLLTEQSRICDVGCAGGRIAGSLPGSVYAIDYSKELLKEAQRRYPGVSFIAGDFQKAQTWSGLTNLDLIISNCAIRKDYSAHLKHFGECCHEALGDNGIILLRVQNVTDLSDVLSKSVRERLFYDEKGLLVGLNMFHWTVERESYRQFFSTPGYVLDFLKKTQLPLPNEVATQRIRRDYLVLKGEKFNKAA